MLKILIERETAAYIVDKAEQAGLTCTADVTCALDENGTWVPWSVRLSGVPDTPQRRQLSECIRKELAIPQQRQFYDGGESA